MELKKVRYYFKATFLSSPSNIILMKPTDFSKQEFMENIYLYLQELSLLDFFI